MAIITRRGSADWLSQLSIDSGYAIKVVENPDGTQSYELFSGQNGNVHVLGYNVEVTINPDGSETYNITGSGEDGKPLTASSDEQMAQLLRFSNINKVVLYIGNTTELYTQNSYYIINPLLRFTPLFKEQTVYGYDIRVIENSDGSETYDIKDNGAGLPVPVSDLAEVTTDSNIGKVFEYENELYVITA